MKLDMESHHGSVERTVTLAEREGEPAGTITVSRCYATTVEDLWDAVTNDSRIPLWFLPISGELELGGSYQFEGNAGGVITGCSPPSQFALTWEFGGDISWVDVSISGGSASRLTLTHTSHLSAHWHEYGPGAAGVGWEMGLLGLVLHVEHPTEPRPDEVEFATSPDGRSFIAASSDGWAQASVAAGTEPAAAHEAAKRTTAFYTGESVE